MTASLRHWHKLGDEPSELKDPPPCCTSAFDKQFDAAERRSADLAEEAVHAERRRVVADAVAAMGAYRDAVRSVLTEPSEVELAERLIGFCVDAVRKVGCVCGWVEVRTFGESKPRRLPDRDPLCGVHDRQGAAA